ASASASASESARGSTVTETLSLDFTSSPYLAVT
ncbi:hypothetical protein NT05LI_2218, partial [Listeria ivanovii FSL F6-596]